VPKKIQRAFKDVVLYQGEDLATYQDFISRLRTIAAEQLHNPRQGDDEAAALSELRSQYDEFIPGAIERGETLRVTAPPGRRFRELVAAHPPRRPVKGDDGETVEEWPDDNKRGCNVDKIATPLVVACVTGEFADRTEATEYVEDLSDGNFNRLVSAAFEVNEETGPDPKVRLSSAIGRISDETSEPLERMD
jgi:hypothetical protein